MMRLWGLTPPQWRELPDEDREEMLAEHREVCPSCGNLRSVCSDPDGLWYPQRSTCHATAALEAVRDKLQKKHGDWKPKPGEHLNPLWGMGVWVSQFDLTPDDDFV